MGLPGAGKTTLAKQLVSTLELTNAKVLWLNADKVREEYNDWDFSAEGRIRQSNRMRELSEKIECHFVIADFVAPLVEMRNNFDADFTVWVDTIKLGRFDDTNKVFVSPTDYDLRVKEQDCVFYSKVIADMLLYKLCQKLQDEVL